MPSRRQEYLRPKIRMRQFLSAKQAGQVEWVYGSFLLLFLGILLWAQLQLEAYQSSARYLEDALAASNLASAIVDVEEYGSSHTILIADPMEAYQRYCIAVQSNLGLDEEWRSGNQTLISGRVIPVSYIIYNVKTDIVDVYEVNADGRMSYRQEMLGAVTAPNGIEIVSTGIYSEISYPVEGILGLTVEARKGKLVDIVRN